MFRHILVPIDPNDEAIWRAALEGAGRMCMAFGAKLSLVAVVPDVSTPLLAQYFPADHEDKLRQRALQTMKEKALPLLPATIKPSLVVIDGTIWRQILETGRKLGCDLIMLGSHQPEFADFLLGSNAEKIVSHAHCSVMVIRSQGETAKG